MGSRVARVETTIAYVDCPPEHAAAWKAAFVRLWQLLEEDEEANRTEEVEKDGQYVCDNESYGNG